MSNSIYKINKGVNQPIMFKGLKAQYIWYLGAGILGLFMVFAVLYIIGISPYICVGLVFTGGGFVFRYVYRMSNKYGEHGMKKMIAKRGIPSTIKSYNRKIFYFENESRNHYSTCKKL